MLGADPQFACMRCFDKRLECERISTRYRFLFARRLATLRAARKSSGTCRTERSSSNPRPPPAANNVVDGPLRLSPPVKEHGNTACDSNCDAPSPAYELLVDGKGSVAGVESTKVTKIWRGELGKVEAMVEAVFEGLHGQ